MFLLLSLTLLGLVLVFFLKNNLKSLRFYKLARKIPGHPTLPILGNALQVSKSKNGILDYFYQSHEKYGNIVRHWLGSTLYVTMTKPEDVEILLRDTQNISKSANYDFLKPWLGLGLVTSTGKHWHTHRKILTPAFHFKITEKFIDVFNEKGKILLRLLEKNVDKPAFDIYPYINIYALDAIIESAMGIKFQAQEESQTDYVLAVHRISELAHKRSFSPILRSQLLFPFTKEGAEQEKVLKILHSQCEEVIQQRKIELQEERLKGNAEETVDDFGVKKRLAFLDLLLKGQMEGNGLSDVEILDEVNTFMFAGHDTTSSGISFTISHLAAHPDIQAKVYEEIQSILLEREECSDITLDDMQNAKYLDLVIKESLRLSPPLAFISRHLETDLKLSDYTLPAGCSASVLIYCVHRNPDIFPNPELFDPNRFTTENLRNRHPYAYIPFSAGPRNCIGQKYAQLEIKCTLMKLLRQYEILPGVEIENIAAVIVLKSTNGHRIRLKRRQ